MKTIIEIVMYLSLVGGYILLINRCSNSVLHKTINIKLSNTLFLLTNIGVLTFIILEEENLLVGIGIILIAMLPQIFKSDRLGIELFYIGLSLNFYIAVIREGLKIGINLSMHKIVEFNTDTFVLMSEVKDDNYFALSGIALVILWVSIKLLKNMFEWMKYQKSDFITGYSARILLIIYLSIDSVIYYEYLLDLSKVVGLMQVLLIDYLIMRYLKLRASDQDKEAQIEILHNLINKQKDHHKKEMNQMQHIRKFKHDYSGMVNGINYLIKSNQVDKLKEFLKDMTDELNIYTKVGIKKYSTDPLVDEIFSSQEEKIKALNIKFDANIILPDNIALTELELCRVFSNALNNSIEACEKLSQDQQRYIKVTTHPKKVGTLIRMINNFNGKIEYSTKSLKTTKIDTKEHGLGLNNIRHILNSRGGNVKINIDQEKKEFELLLFIPQQ